jgi:hypothetical protein
MAINIKDLIEGKGPDYILLVKYEGKYSIFCAGEKIQEIVDHIEKIKSNVKQRKNTTKKK